MIIPCFFLTDIAPGNIGLTENGQLKLFGFNRSTCLKRNTQITERYELIGLLAAPFYTAPEAVLWRPYNEKVDLYSVGMIFWQLVCGGGQPPFKGISPKEHLQKVVVGGQRPPIGKDVDASLAALIEQCWQNDSEGRISAAGLSNALEKDALPFAGSSTASMLMKAVLDFFRGNKVIAEH